MIPVTRARVPDVDSSSPGISGGTEVGLRIYLRTLVVDTGPGPEGSRPSTNV